MIAPVFGTSTRKGVSIGWPVAEVSVGVLDQPEQAQPNSDRQNSCPAARLLEAPTGNPFGLSNHLSRQ
jgi:hypothetical protein